MKVIWFINNEIPYVNSNNKSFVNEGWLGGMLDALNTYHSNDLSIYVVYPQKKSLTNIVNNLGFIQAIGYYDNNSMTFNNSLENIFYEIIKNINPNVIHVMGSEYPHTFSVCNACEKLGLLDKMVISIQGLIYRCALVYTEGIPFIYQIPLTLRDIIKGGILQEKKKFIYRGKYENFALLKCKNVIGRTSWDNKCVKDINENIVYYFNYEVLRNSFYSNECWNYEKCEKNTIFVSQGGYPIKGLHYLLKALSIVKINYPNIKLCIAGTNIINKKIYNVNTYALYIKKLIRKYKLRENVVFLGQLSEDKMRSQYLNSNIVVSPSILENSSNSIGEAMILGVPVVASNVGGTNNFIKNGVNGLLYQYNDVNQLADSIIKLLGDSKLQHQFSENERLDALRIYDKKNNSNELMNIYNNISKN